MVWDDDVGTTTIARVDAGAGALEPALELCTGSGGTELGLTYWMGWGSVLTNAALELDGDGGSDSVWMLTDRARTGG